jgi:hypothetical protein
MRSVPAPVHPWPPWHRQGQGEILLAAVPDTGQGRSQAGPGPSDARAAMRLRFVRQDVQADEGQSQDVRSRLCSADSSYPGAAAGAGSKSMQTQRLTKMLHVQRRCIIEGCGRRPPGQGRIVGSALAPHAARRSHRRGPNHVACSHRCSQRLRRDDRRLALERAKRNRRRWPSLANSRLIEISREPIVSVIHLRNNPRRQPSLDQWLPSDLG